MSTPKKSKPYVRLARARGGIGTYDSLWLGADHLLAVSSSGYTENYQRFYFGEIKGFFVTRIRHAAITMLASGAVALAAAVPLTLSILRHEFSLWPWFLIFFALIVLLLGGLMGTNCRVHVITGVQTVRLPSLSRYRRTRKVLARLHPLIKNAQTGLVPADDAGNSMLSTSPAAQLDASPQGIEFAPPPVPPISAAPPPLPPRSP